MRVFTYTFVAIMWIACLSFASGNDVSNSCPGNSCHNDSAATATVGNVTSSSTSNSTAIAGGGNATATGGRAELDADIRVYGGDLTNITSVAVKPEIEVKPTIKNENEQEQYQGQGQEQTAVGSVRIEDKSVVRNSYHGAAASAAAVALGTCEKSGASASTPGLGVSLGGGMSRLCALQMVFANELSMRASGQELIETAFGVAGSVKGGKPSDKVLAGIVEGAQKQIAASFENARKAQAEIAKLAAPKPWYRRIFPSIQNFFYNEN